MEASQLTYVAACVLPLLAAVFFLFYYSKTTDKPVAKKEVASSSSSSKADDSKADSAHEKAAVLKKPKGSNRHDGGGAEKDMACCSTGEKVDAKEGCGTGCGCVEEDAGPTRVPLRIVFGGTTGHSEGFARQLEKDVFALNVSNFHFETSLVDIKDYDQDNLEQETIIVFCVSTWTDGEPPESAVIFFEWLKDLVLDFRVSREMLKHVKFSIFGLGNSLYDENYCKASTTLLGYMESLGAEPFHALGKGDDQVDQQVSHIQPKP